MIFQKIGIAPASIKSLVGAMILKFSTAVIGCWGSINLYILSHFHYQGTQITSSTNSIILLVSVPPMVIGLVFANRLCLRFGYQIVIRLCCLIFFISPLFNLISFNIHVFCIFGITIPGAMFALISVPVLNCVWTHFQNSKSKATAILVVAFGVGTIIWNLLFMHMINPNNQNTIDQHKKINFFSRQVTKNVQKTTIIGFALTGLLAILGSLLLSRKNETSAQLKQESPQVQDIRSSSNTQLSSIKTSLTLKQAFCDERFIIIMTVSFLSGLYEIFLLLNFKIIFMPMVNDDHFLSYLTMVCSIVGILGAFIWGFLGDHKGVIWSILILSILDFVGKIYSDFAVTKPTIVVMIVFIGLISRSMTTLAGPGFVQIFGLKLGTQLLQYKAISILFGYIMVPLFQILTSNLITPHQYLICISLLSIITLLCAIRLYWICQKQKKQKPVVEQFYNDQIKDDLPKIGIQQKERSQDHERDKKTNIDRLDANSLQQGTKKESKIDTLK